MTLGHNSIDDDVGENLLIVNKMAKVFRQGKLWSRNRDGKDIIKALKNVMPQASRRKCVLHFQKNFISNYLGESELHALDPPFELRKRGGQKKHKRRKNRLPIPPQLSTIQPSGTKRCKKCKELDHNSLTCGQPRDENGRFKYKKKSRKNISNLVGRPRKIQRVNQASTSTAAASGVPTQSSQAI
ncbi:hypothetical protein Cgig2_003700 [Carnegiea gigantea]|uniref:Uncharacterized protein n=1 Tax=Carnegiea gigantea TaxID=171969 RepID=A0A9Q1KGZ0_9CARY|nr:hypothetical protein Cgig2_003700 [Carnegiea gigantea]